MNRLASESSPYLLQHRDNPIDWVPWSHDAFAQARREDKPIFLSIGYSSCHWCHVMAHESFESDQVAAILNEHFVSIKVDREERPDIDEAYMTAVQLVTGRGGWPMTVFMTPAKEPFFAGTYLPREDRGDHIGFLTLCRHIADLWRTQRAKLVGQAGAFAATLREALNSRGDGSSAQFDHAFVDRSVRALFEAFDEVHTGFGGAPKFPPHTAIDFLLSYHALDGSDADLRLKARYMALSTLERMALGGIHDHVGGGFHRYSTDAEWRLPHFEKMLYDNALMLSNFARGMDIAKETAPAIAYGRAGIVRWLEGEMTTPGDCYASALDADAEGGEGAFYLWTMAELRQILGTDADAFVAAFGIERNGNIVDEATGSKTGANVLIRRDADQDFAPELERLREARGMRPHPFRDEKAIVAWNGLAIYALAPLDLASAERAAKALLDAESRHGRLPHMVIGGVPSGEAFLEDFAALARGLFRLGEMRPTESWREQAMRLTQRMIEQFWDERAGGFFSSSIDHEDLFGRTKPVYDQPLPSGNALGLQCLIDAGDYEKAWALLDWALGWMERAPHATEALHAAALPMLSHARENRKIETEFAMEGNQWVVVLRLPRGIHVNGHFIESRDLTPTTVEVEDATIEYPLGETYTGEVRIRVDFHAEPRPVTLHYQACTQSECWAPVSVVLRAITQERRP